MKDLKDRLENLKEKLDVAEKERRVAELEKEIQRPDFWQDSQVAQKKMKELGSLKSEIEQVEELELYLAEGEEKLLAEGLEKLEFKTFLSGPYARGDALLSIHAGQGGTEACDWSEMLARMYVRFAEKQGWKSNEIDRKVGEEAGIKSAVFEVGGEYAYGYLRGEAGVHRLVRQSPFNADNLRQTSFAMVEVIPLLGSEAAVQVDPKDVQFEAYRSSGHGGQNVNKVSTAVRLKHLPTGIAVECQAERSQAQNRQRAMRILSSKLQVLEEQKTREKEAKLKGVYKVPGWGNQIRSYVLHPYKLVKDLRTKLESTDPEAVLDGELLPFVEVEVRQRVGVV